MGEPQKRPGVTFFSSFRSDRLWTLLGVKYEGGREGGASTALNCFMGEMRTTANPVNWHISVSSSLCAVMNFMREGGVLLGHVLEGVYIGCGWGVWKLAHL